MNDESRKKLIEKQRKYNKQYYSTKVKGQISTTNNNTPWKSKEVNLIMNSNLTVRDISLKLGRSIMAIYCKKRQVESAMITGGYHNLNKALTPEDIHFIKNNHGKMTGKEIAKHIKRPLQTIYQIATPPKVNPEKRKLARKKFKENNPNYFKDYYHNVMKKNKHKG